MLVRQGYIVMGKWTNKYFDVEEKEPLWSMKLTGLDATRVLLWEEKDHWICTVSIAVGKYGEFPVCEGIIKRSKTKIIPKMEKMTKKIEETRNQIYRWNWSSASPYAHIALARLSNYFISKAKIRKALAVNFAIIKGDILGATVTEALSMVQDKFASSREDRLASAIIWGEVYR